MTLRLFLLAVCFSNLSAFALNDYPYEQTVGASVSREACVTELIGQVLRRTRHQQDIRITGASTYFFARLFDQYNVTAVSASGVALAGFAIVSFEQAENALICRFANRNALNAGPRLLLSTDNPWHGGYDLRRAVLLFSDSGFLFEANP